MKKWMLFAGLLSAFTFSCHDEADNSCKQLREDLLLRDFPAVKAELDQWLYGNLPEPTRADPLGHEANLVDFVNRLHELCDFDTGIGCYACIETYPLQSEVYIRLDSVGAEVQRVLDVFTPEQGSMTLRDMH